MVQNLHILFGLIICIAFGLIAVIDAHPPLVGDIDELVVEVAVRLVHASVGRLVAIIEHGTFIDALALAFVLMPEEVCRAL